MYLTFCGLCRLRGFFNSWGILSLFAVSLTDHEITEDYGKVFIRMSVNVNCIQWEEILLDKHSNAIDGVYITVTYTF